MGSGKPGMRPEDVIRSKLKGRLVLLDNKEKDVSIGAMRRKRAREAQQGGLGARGEAVHGSCPPTLGTRQRQPFFDLFVAKTEVSSDNPRFHYGHYDGLRRIWKRYSARIIADRVGSKSCQGERGNNIFREKKNSWKIRQGHAGSGAIIDANISAERERERARVLGNDM